MNEDLFAKYGTILKVVGVIFVGMHIPLILSALVWLGIGQSEPKILMLSVLSGTVAGLLISVGGIWSVLRSRGLVPA